MWFIGDVHGHHKWYFRLLENMHIDCSIALGDLGMGLPNSTWPNQWDESHKFIRGNHDNPQECLDHPNYLGEFGYLEKQDIYYVSGAWSIDSKGRIPYHDFWPEEELNYLELQQVIDEIQEFRPRIIVSHDCPSSIRADLFGFNKFYNTRTGNAFDIVFEKFQPEYWIFGHYHRGRRAVINETEFLCLQELEMFEIPEIKWQ